MKIKFNWGTGIFIVILLFFGTIALRIYIAYQRDVTLVEKDYYPQELKHQDVINKMKNVSDLSAPVQLNLKGSILTLTFPPDFRNKAFLGKIELYRPSDPNLDQTYYLKNDTSLVREIITSGLKHGKYVLKLDWSAENKEYYTEIDLFGH